MSLISIFISLGSMSHVDFKKRPCRPVDFRGQGPSTYLPGEDLDTAEGLCVVIRGILHTAIQQLGNGDEGEEYDEHRDVEQYEPLEETEVRRDTTTKLSFDFLQVSPPQIDRVGHLRKIVFEPLP